MRKILFRAYQKSSDDSSKVHIEAAIRLLVGKSNQLFAQSFLIQSNIVLSNNLNVVHKMFKIFNYHTANAILYIKRVFRGG